MGAPRKGSAVRFALGLVAAAVLLGGCGPTGERSGTDQEEVPPAERGTYLHVVAPSVVARGEKTEVRLRVITQAGLPDYDFEGAFRFQASSPDVEFPPNLIVEPMKEGWFRLQDLVFDQRGVQFLKGEVPKDTVEALANPINVIDDPGYRIYWGDLNGHSDLSSGVKSPGVYFWYARTVALLDFVALTDNDREERLEKVLDDFAFHDIEKVVEEEHNQPGRFVAFVGMEWTSREYGNRLVLFSRSPESLPSVAAGYDTPAKLRAALPEGSVMIVPHPSGSAAADPVDPASVDTADLVEVYSSRGDFEAPGSARPSTQETAGASVGDLLKRGWRPGFVGDSDTELSTPGNPRGFSTQDHPWPGGLTAVLAPELTREAVLEALREHRCYATTGMRYLLEFMVDGNPMGSVMRVPVGHRAEVYGSLGSTTRWVRVEIVGPDGPVAELTPDPEDADVVELEHTTDAVTEPTWIYLRGVDEHGGMAWSSPVYLVPE